MSIFDPLGFWVFGNDGARDEEDQEKEHQEELCRLMEQYHAYMDMVKEKAYVLRGSKIGCQYGTKENVLIDIYKDHGVVWGMTQFPLVTIEDCRPDNIHHFGYCKCPETQYAGRLPMTKGSWGEEEEKIVQADGNIFSHICVPLIKKDQKWKQVDDDLLIDVGNEDAEPALLEDAVLVCQYGGIIWVTDVPEDITVEDDNTSSNYGIDYDLNEDEKLFVAVVAAESIGEGELGWQVVANVIMNRIGSGEWKSFATPRQVIEQPLQFSCLLEGGSDEYLKAKKYLDNRVDNNGIYEQIISVVMPIYYGETTDITRGAQLYYSPKSMKPPGSAPDWAASYKEITVDGIDPNAFVLFTCERVN